MTSLLGTKGPIAGRRVDVEHELSLGREDADVLIDDPEVSRAHAVVRKSGDGIVIEDSGSTNGTFVNGKQISGPTYLSPGDLVRVGQSEFLVEVPTVVSATAPEPEHTVVSEPVEPSESPAPAEEGDFAHAYSTEPLPAGGVRRNERRATGELKAPRHERARAWMIIAGAALLIVILVWAVNRLLYDDPVTEYKAGVGDVCEGSFARLERLDLTASKPRALRRDARRAAAAVSSMRGDIADLEPPAETRERSVALRERLARVNQGLNRLRRTAGARPPRVRAARSAVASAVRAAERAAADAGLNRCGRWPRL